MFCESSYKPLILWIWKSGLSLFELGPISFRLHDWSRFNQLFPGCGTSTTDGTQDPNRGIFYYQQFKS